MIIDFEAELWIWAARRADTWTFVSLPADAAAEIRDRAAGLSRGFGSLRVEATIGTSIWRTSIFPDGARESYVLPVKRAIRAAQQVNPGDTIAVSVQVIDLP
ncbi:DUF1905 domain-containing protein [Actinoplanes sp. TFC3]|uniref:DUF1905 domain-containing protein n=1 Tax=Actinoplanes sp. TFC3 TaxID=1710355 RepID=UPI000829F6DD|nr:DUF1905 domain-containing protein [Actinoplanes sp. TFC3]